MKLVEAIKYYKSIENLPLTKWLNELQDLRQENLELKAKLSKLEATDEENKELVIPEHLRKHEDLKDEDGKVIIRGELLDIIAKNRTGTPERYHIKLKLNHYKDYHPSLSIDACSCNDALLKWAEITKSLDSGLDFEGKTYYGIPISIRCGIYEFGLKEQIDLPKDVEEAIIKGQMERMYNPLSTIHKYELGVVESEYKNLLSISEIRGVNSEEAKALWISSNFSDIIIADMNSCTYILKEPMSAQFLDSKTIAYKTSRKRCDIRAYKSEKLEIK